MSNVDHIQHDDGDIVRGLREGTEEGFAIFYQVYSCRLTNFVARSLGDPTAASDIVHEAMIIVRSRIGQLRDDTHFAAWVYAITRNEMRAHARRRSRTVLTSSIPDEAVEPDLAQQVDSRQLTALLGAALEGLNPREQLVYRFHVVAGMPIDRVAAVLGLSVANTRKLVQRVRVRVAQSMGAVVLTKPGCNDCPDFQQVLVGWDGRLSPLWRKRIARHVDTCSGCEQRCEGVISLTAGTRSKKVSLEPRLQTLSV